MTIDKCPYCFGKVHRVDGTVIYPHRSDLADKSFWLCRKCWAYVGCHPGTVRPLGRLANTELRKWKQAAHAAFDPLWRDGKLTRKDAYRRLSELLGIPEDDTHIGMFDVHDCKRVIEAVKGFVS